MKISIGQTFGRLTVKEFAGWKRVGIRAVCRRKVWKCSCSCGSQKEVTQLSLVSGTESCGCLAREATIKRNIDAGLNIVGLRFAMLTVTGKSDLRAKNGVTLWVCKCDCGKETTAAFLGKHSKSRLLSRKSCGCSVRQMVAESKITHGATKRINGKVMAEKWYTIFIAAKTRARKSRTLFDMEYLQFRDWAEAKMVENGGICPILMIPMKHNTQHRGSDSISLDRLEPAKGYVIGNLDLISHRANQIKNDATRSELLSVLRYMDERAPHRKLFA